MAPQRSEIAAHKRQELLDALDSSRVKWEKHRRSCYPCRFGQNDPGGWCYPGYELARELHRAYAAYHDYCQAQIADRPRLL